MGRSIAYQPDRESQGQNEMLVRKAWAERSNDAYLSRVNMMIAAEAERAGVHPLRATVYLANGERPR